MKYTSIVLLAVLSIVHSADLNTSPNDENPVPAKKSTNSQDDIFRGIIEKQQELFSVNITDITKTVKQQREDLFGVLRDFAEKYALADDKDAYMLKWFNKSAQHYKNEYEEYEALVFTCEIMFDHDSRCHLEYPEDPPVKVPVNVTVEAPIEEKEEEEEKGFFGKIWSWFGG